MNFIVIAAVGVCCFMLGILYQLMVNEVMPSNVPSVYSTIGQQTVHRTEQHEPELPSSSELRPPIAFKDVQNFPIAMSDSRREFLSEPGFGDIPLPPVVEAWQRGMVDWHDLLPEHNTFLEKFGDSSDSKFNFMKLVAKEEAITDYLTRYKESGLQAEYGVDHGPLLAYTGCNLLKDPCMIHDHTRCEFDDFCVWEHNKGLCVQGFSARSLESCPNPQSFDGSKFSAAAASTCKSYIHQPVFLDSVDSDQASMFYHWWSHFQKVYAAWDSGGSPRQSHFLITKYPLTKFFHYFGVLSDNCWRRAQLIPRDVCFCKIGRASCRERVL